MSRMSEPRLKIRKNRARYRRSRRHLFEQLEHRHLLAADITVDSFLDIVDANDGVTTLREAVLQANSDGQATTITLPAGTYTLSLEGSGENMGLTGDLDIVADGSLTILGAGAAQTIIDAGGSSGLGDRIFQVFGGANLSIDGLTVMGGDTRSGAGSETAGGGIRVMETGTLNVNDSVIGNNRAGFAGGGGIANSNGTVGLTNTTIADNDAPDSQARGGGISSGGGSLSIRSSRIENNQSYSDAGAFVVGAFFIENTIVQANTARTGGTGGLALSGIGGNNRILASTFVDNEGVVGGFSVTAGRASDRVLVANTTVVGNRGDYGGVSTSCGNVSSSCGYGDVTFVNTTIAGNVGTSTGGVWLGYHKKPDFANTVIAGNVVGAESTPSDLVGVFGFPTATHSMIGDASSAFGITHDSDGDFSSGTNNIVGINGSGTIDPTTIFVDLNDDGVIDQHDLADNGGPTPTLLLRSGSLAVDAGSDSQVSSAGLTTDQRGAGFPRISGFRADIGATEIIDNRLYWTGEGDGRSWDQATNWRRYGSGIHQVPNEDSDVIIAAEDYDWESHGFDVTVGMDSDIQVFLGAGVSVNSMVVSDGDDEAFQQSLVVPAHRSLTVSGDVTIGQDGEVEVHKNSHLIVDKTFDNSGRLNLISEGRSGNRPEISRLTAGAILNQTQGVITQSFARVDQLHHQVYAASTLLADRLENHGSIILRDGWGEISGKGRGTWYATPIDVINTGTITVDSAVAYDLAPVGTGGNRDGAWNLLVSNFGTFDNSGIIEVEKGRVRLHPGSDSQLNHSGEILVSRSNPIQFNYAVLIGNNYIGQSLDTHWTGGFEGAKGIAFQGGTFTAPNWTNKELVLFSNTDLTIGQITNRGHIQFINVNELAPVLDGSTAIGRLINEPEGTVELRTGSTDFGSRSNAQLRFTRANGSINGESATIHTQLINRGRLLAKPGTDWDDQSVRITEDTGNDFVGSDEFVELINEAGGFVDMVGTLSTANHSSGQSGYATRLHIDVINEGQFDVGGREVHSARTFDNRGGAVLNVYPSSQQYPGFAYPGLALTFNDSFDSDGLVRFHTHFDGDGNPIRFGQILFRGALTTTQWTIGAGHHIDSDLPGQQRFLVVGATDVTLQTPRWEIDDQILANSNVNVNLDPASGLDSSVITIRDGGRINVARTFRIGDPIDLDIEDGGRIHMNIGNSSSAPTLDVAGSITNEGLIDVYRSSHSSGGAPDALTRIEADDLLNRGTLRFYSHPGAVGNNYQHLLDADVVNEGLVQIDNRTPLVIGRNADVSVVNAAGGTWRINDLDDTSADPAIQYARAAFINEGYFETAAGNHLEFPLGFENRGTFAIANLTGRVDLLGHLTQTETGVLQLGIRELDEADRLHVTGTVALGGTLDVGLKDGYLPIPEQSYRLLSHVSGQRTGDFASVLGLGESPNGVVLSRQTDASGMTIQTFGDALSAPPVAQPDDYRINDGGTLNATSVLANDSDLDAETTLTAVLVDGPGNAKSFSFQPDGTFTYQPRDGFVGIDRLTYRATDGGTVSRVTTATIEVFFNNPPQLLGELFNQTGTEDVPFVYELPENLFVDNDENDSISLEAHLVDQNGLLMDLPEGLICGALCYEPGWIEFIQDSVTGRHRFDGPLTEGSAGIHTLRVTATDSFGKSNFAEFDLLVMADVDPNGTVVIKEDSGPVTIDLWTTGELDETFGQLTDVGLAEFGTTEQGVGASVFYTPPSDFFGSDSLTFTFSRSGGLEPRTATLSLTVEPVNDAPRIQHAPDWPETYAENSGAVPVLRNSARFDDVDDARFSAVVVAITSGYVRGEDRLLVHGGSEELLSRVSAQFNTETGVLTLLGRNGQATIADFESVLELIRFENSSDDPTEGERQLTITLTDANSSAAANGTQRLQLSHAFSVIAENDPPTARPDLAYVQKGGTTTIAILANDFDPEGDVFEIVGLSEPTGGTATLNADNTVEYRADEGFEGQDTFTYTVRDIFGAESTATVTVSVSDASELIDALNAGMSSFVEQFSDFDAVVPLVQSTINLFAEVNVSEQFEAVVQQVGHTIFSSVLTDQLEAEMNSRGAQVNYFAGLQPREDGVIFEATIDLSTLDAVEATLPLDLSSINAYSVHSLAGTVSLSLTPRGAITFGVDQGGFFIGSEGSFGVHVQAESFGSGETGPFRLEMFGTAEITPGIDFLGVDQDGNERLTLNELGTAEAFQVSNFDWEMPETETRGQATFDLVMPMLDYVPVDDDPHNNSPNGGDPFRIRGVSFLRLFEQDGDLRFDAGSPSDGAVPGDIFQIKNPDINENGVEDFTTGVFLDNVFQYGGSQIKSFLESADFEFSFADSIGLAGTEKKANDGIDFSAVADTLNELVGAFDINNPDATGEIELSELLDFDDVANWLTGGIPAEPVDIVQIQLNRFHAEAKTIEIDLDDLLPVSMRDDGWTIQAEAVAPSIRGTLTFGIDTDTNPFYLQTGATASDGGDDQVANSQLSAGLPIIVSVANPSLLPGRLTLDEVFGAIRPDITIDFTGLGGADQRLRWNESSALANTLIDVAQDSLDSLEFRLRGKLLLPEFQAPDASEPPALEVFGSMNGIGSDFQLTSRISPNQIFAIGGYEVDTLSVAFSKVTDSATGDRNHTASWFGRLSIPIAKGNDLTLEAGGSITEELTFIEGSATLDSIELGEPDRTFLLMQNPTIAADLTVYRDPLQPVVGGIEISIDKTVIHPRVHVSQESISSNGETALDEATKRARRQPDAEKVAAFLETEVDQVLDSYGPLVGDAGALVTFAEQHELEPAAMRSAFDILTNVVRYSSKSDRAIYEQDPEKDGLLARAAKEARLEAERIKRRKDTDVVADFLQIEQKEAIARFGILIPQAHYVVVNASLIPIPSAHLDAAFVDLERAMRRASKADADEFIESGTGPLQAAVQEILVKLDRQALETAVSVVGFPEEALLTDLTGLELVALYNDEPFVSGRQPGEHDPADPSQDPQTYLTMVELGKQIGLQRAYKRAMVTGEFVDQQAVEIDTLTSNKIFEMHALAVALGQPSLSEAEWIHDQRVYDAFRDGGVEDGENTVAKFLLQDYFEFPDSFIDNDSVHARDYLEIDATLAALGNEFLVSTNNTLERTHQKVEAAGSKVGKNFAIKLGFDQTVRLDPSLINDDAVPAEYILHLIYAPRLQGLPELVNAPIDHEDPQWYALYKELGFEGALRTLHQVVIAELYDELTLAAELDVDPEDMIYVRFSAGVDLQAEVLQDRDFWKRVKEVGAQCAIAERTGDATGGVCPAEPAEPYWARIAIEGFSGRIESTGRLQLSVDEAEFQLDRFLRVHAEGAEEQGQTIPAATLDLNPSGSPDDPLITFHKLSASIPAIEALPSISLESLKITSRGIDVGGVSMSQDLIDFGFATAEDVTISVSPQALDFSDPFVIPNLEQVLFETGKLVVLPDSDGDGLVEAPQGVSLLYRNGQFLATLPQFEVEFDRFSSTLQGASFFLSGGQGNPDYGRIRIDEAQVSVAATGGTVSLTARDLKILSDRDGDGLPQVRYSSISLGSAEGLATSFGLGDFLPLELTELRFTPGQTVDDQAPSFEVLAKGYFNIDLLADRVDFDPYLIFRKLDSDDLLDPPPGGDGKITSNDDVDNAFEVTLIYDEHGTRITELPGRLGLGIDNLEAGPFVFAGEIYLGQFVDGLMPSEFGGFLEIDTSPPDNPERPELRNLTSDEKLSDDEKPPVESLPEEVLTNGEFSLDPNASLESIRLAITGNYTPAELEDADSENDFSLLKIEAALDVGLQLGLGDLLQLHGFGGTVSMTIREDRSDDELDPEFSVSLENVRIGLARFNLGGVFTSETDGSTFNAFTAETVGATFDFTGPSDSNFAEFKSVTIGSDVIGIEGTVENLQINRRGLPVWSELGGITVSTTDNQDNLLQTILGYMPLVVDEFGFSFNDGFYERDADDTVVGVADVSQVTLIVSGGVQTPERWPEELQEYWPLTGRISGLKVDIGKLFDGQFPITDFRDVTLGIKPIELGPVKIGGTVKLALLEEDGEVIYARFNPGFGGSGADSEKFVVRVEADDDGKVPDDAFPMIYGRLYGEFNGFDIAGGIDAVAGAMGLVRAKLTVPPVPLGPVTLTGVGGGIDFGITDLRSVENPFELVSDPVFFDPFPADDAGLTAALEASVIKALDTGVPTMAHPFTIGLTGGLTAPIPGVISGDADFVLNVDLSELGIGLDDEGLPSLNTGARWLGTANLKFFGMPLGRAGMMADMSDYLNPRFDIAAALPPEDSPLAFISAGKVDVLGTLDLQGIALLPLVGMRTFLDSLASDAVGTAASTFDDSLELLAERLNNNPQSRLALALDESLARSLYEGSAGQEDKFTGQRIKELLLGTGNEPGLLPSDFSFLADALAGDGSAGIDPVRLMSLANGLLQELPTLAVDPELVRSALIDGDPNAIGQFATQVITKATEMNAAIASSLVGAAGDGLIGAAEYFDPRLELEGAFTPMMFGMPMGATTGGRISVSKYGLELGVQTGVLDLVKKFGPTGLVMLATPLGYMSDQLDVDARLDFVEPEEFLKLIFPPEEGPYDPQPLIDHMIDQLNPLNPKWTAAVSGGLTAFGFSLADIDGLLFGPQWDDDGWIFAAEDAEPNIVTDRLRAVTTEVPEDLSEELLRFVIVVDETIVLPAGESYIVPAGKPYRVYADKNDIPLEIVQIEGTERLEDILRFGGMIVGSGLDLPRLISDPLGVLSDVHAGGEKDENGALVRSGWLPPALPDLSPERLSNDGTGALADLAAFATDINDYRIRLIDELTAETDAADAELYIPSFATLFDLDTYTDLDSYLNSAAESTDLEREQLLFEFLERVLRSDVTDTETNSEFADSILAITRDIGGDVLSRVETLLESGVSTAADRMKDLFNSAYARGEAPLEFLSVDWGEVAFEADLGGMSFLTELPILAGLNVELQSRLRYVSVFDMVGEFLESPLNRAVSDLTVGVAGGAVSGVTALGDQLFAMLDSVFPDTPVDQVLETYRQGGDLLPLLPQSLRDQADEMFLSSLGSMLELFDFEVPLPVAAAQLELGTENFHEWVRDDSGLKDLTDVGLQLIENLFGEQLVGDLLGLDDDDERDSAWIRDLANMSIEVYTPMYSPMVDGQEAGIEQNGGFRFGLDMSIPGLIEEAAVTIEVQMTEALGELNLSDLFVRDFTVRAEAARLSLPIGLDNLITINDVAIDLTKSDQGVSAHVRGFADVLGNGHAMIGDLQLLDGGFAGLLLLRRDQPEPLLIGGGHLEGSLMFQFNTTGRDVELSETPISEDLLTVLDEAGVSEMTISPGVRLHAVGELTLPEIGSGVKLIGQFDLQSSRANDRNLLEIAASGSLQDSASEDGLFSDAIDVFGYLRFGGNVLPTALDAATFTLDVNDVALLPQELVSISGSGKLELNNTGLEVRSPLLLNPIPAGDFLQLDLLGEVSIGSDLGFGGDFSLTLEDGLIPVSIEARFGQSLDVSFTLDRSVPSVGFEFRIEPDDLADLTTMLRDLGISSTVSEMLDSGHPKFDDGTFLDMALEVGPSSFSFELKTVLSVSNGFGSLSGMADIIIGRNSFEGTLSGELKIGLLTDSVTAVIQPDRCIKVTPENPIFLEETFSFPLSANACKPILVLGDVAPVVEGGEAVIPFEILNLDPADYGWDEGQLKVYFNTHGGLSATPRDDFAYLRNQRVLIEHSDFDGDIYRGQFIVPTLDDEEFELTEAFRVSVERVDFDGLRGQRFDPLGIQRRIAELQRRERELRGERDTVRALCLTPSSFDALGCLDALSEYAQEGTNAVLEFLSDEIAKTKQDVENAMTCSTSGGNHNACSRVPGIQLTSAVDIAIPVMLPADRFRTVRIEDDGDEADKFVPTAPSNAIVFYSFQPIPGTNADASVSPEIATLPASNFGFNGSTRFRFAEGVPDSQDATDSVSRGASPPIGINWTRFPATYQLPELVGINSSGEPVLINDQNSGTGYLMYSEQNLFDRFPNNPPYNESGKTPNSSHFIAVRTDGVNWQYDDNATWHPFQPRESDRLIASINFSTSEVDLLKGLAGDVFGIRSGYDIGDLVVQVHTYEGRYNRDELLITGTSFGDIAPAGFQFTVDQDGENFSPNAIEFWDKPSFVQESWDLFVLQAGRVSAIIPAEIAIPTISIAENVTAHPELDGWRKLRVEIPTVFDVPGEVSFRLVPKQDPTIHYATGTLIGSITTLDLRANRNVARPIIDNIALLQGPEPNLVDGKSLRISLEDADISIVIDGPGRIEYSPGILDPLINPVRLRNFLPSIQLHNVDATSTVTVSVFGQQSGAGPLTFANFASSAGFAELNMTAAGAIGGRISLGGPVEWTRFDSLVEGSRFSMIGLDSDEVTVTATGSIVDADIQFPGDVKFDVGGSVVRGDWVLGAMRELNVGGGFSARTSVARNVGPVWLGGNFDSTLFEVRGDITSLTITNGNFSTNLAAEDVGPISLTSTLANPVQMTGSIDARSLQSVSLFGGNIDGANIITGSRSRDIEFISVLPNAFGVGGQLRSFNSLHFAGGIQSLQAHTMLVNLVAGGEVGLVEVGSDESSGLLIGNITAPRVGTVDAIGDASFTITTTASEQELGDVPAIGQVLIRDGIWRGGRLETREGTTIGSFEIRSTDEQPVGVSLPLAIQSDRVELLHIGYVDAEIFIDANVGTAEIDTAYVTIGFLGHVESLVVGNDLSPHGVLRRSVDQTGDATATSTLSGRVFYDKNADGRRDPDEPFLPGRHVELLAAENQVLARQPAIVFDVNRNGIIEEDLEDGGFQFTRMVPGNYRVQLVSQDLLNAISAEIVVSQEANSTFDFAIARPWTNPFQVEDVNGSGDISPIDALVVINYINRRGVEELLFVDQANLRWYLDVDGDGRVQPLDALRVINHLNRTPSGEGEASVNTVLDMPFARTDNDEYNNLDLAFMWTEAARDRDFSSGHIVPSPDALRVSNRPNRKTDIYVDVASVASANSVIWSAGEFESELDADSVDAAMLTLLSNDELS